MSENITTLRKITVQSFGSIKDDKGRKEVAKEIMVVVGRCDCYTEETGTYGEYYRLYGDFIAVSPSGEKIRSDTIILPGYLNKKIVAALESHVNKETREMAPIEFAFKIMTLPDKAYGYTYVAEPIGQSNEAEDRLLARVSGVISKVLTKQ